MTITLPTIPAILIGLALLYLLVRFIKWAASDRPLRPIDVPEIGAPFDPRAVGLAVLLVAAGTAVVLWVSR
jgi:hypothetical protein